MQKTWLSLLLTIGTCWQTLPAQTWQPGTLPPPGEHPRIFFNASDVPALRQRILESRQGEVVRQRLEQARQSLPKWRQFAALDLNKPDAATVQTWFKSDESRNIQWGLLALDAVVREDAEQKKLMGAVISNYAKLILASKALGTGQIANGGTGTGLGKAETLWKNNNFDVGISWLIGAAGLPVAYDLLFNDMTPDQRAAVHDALAAATAGRRPWGSDNPLGRAVSNWYGYHGELAVMLAAIEGEPGYDAATYHRIEKILLDYFEIGYTPEGACHEDSYGPNLGFRAGGLGYLVLARRGHDIFATEKFHNIVRYFAQDAQPFRGGSFVGGASGTGLVYPSSIILFKHVLPADPAANYLYRYFFGDDYKGLAAQQSQLEFALFGSDWSGDPGKPLAAAEMGLPLSVFSPERGKLISRSDWTAQAADLHFDARPDAFIIGHDTVDRGNFSFMALGRSWTHIPAFRLTTNSTDFSLPHIDGKAEAWKAPSVKFLRHEDDGTLASGGAADLKYAYDWQWTPPWPKADEKLPPPWEPEMSDPRALGWPDDPAWLPHKIYGEAGIGHIGSYMWRRPYNAVQKAFRSAVLVRGAKPYALIVDDLRKDDQPHAYDWYMQLEPDVTLEKQDGGDVILRDPKDDRRLLVRVLQGEGFGGAKVESYPLAPDRKTAVVTTGNRLILSAKSVEPKYKILLYPFHAGEPLPITTWNADKSHLQMTNGAQVETIACLPNTDGRTRLEITRAETSYRLN